MYSSLVLLWLFINIVYLKEDILSLYVLGLVALIALILGACLLYLYLVHLFYVAKINLFFYINDAQDTYKKHNRKYKYKYKDEQLSTVKHHCF